MRLSICLLALLMDVSSTLSYNDGINDPCYGRQKRSLWAASRMVFRGAELITKSPELRLYYKNGGLKRAIDDFNNLHPRMVKDNGVHDKVGMVGNDRVYLTEMEGYPAIVIPGKSMDNKYRLDRVILYKETTTSFDLKIH